MPRRTFWGWLTSLWSPAPPTPELPPGERLLEAARQGDWRLARTLLAQGVAPDDTRTQFRQTALWLAADNGHTEAVRVLLAAQANPAAEDIAGNNALVRAAAGGYDDIIRVFASTRPAIFRSWSATTALLHAVLSGHSFAVRELLVNGVAPDRRSPGFPTALMVAAVTDSSCVAELLDGGADPNERDEHGQGPLHYAAVACEHESIRLLLVAGAFLEAVDDTGRSPRDVATTDLVRDVLAPPPPTADLNRADRVAGN